VRPLGANTRLPTTTTLPLALLPYQLLCCKAFAPPAHHVESLLWDVSIITCCSLNIVPDRGRSMSPSWVLCTAGSLSLMTANVSGPRWRRAR
jgi:hypothetical protein